VSNRGLFFGSKVDSARLLVKRIEVLENEYQERVKAIVLGEIVSCSDYRLFIIHIQGNRPDVPYQRISEFIDREIIMPSDKKVVD
jgi:hypothetical protein